MKLPPEAQYSRLSGKTKLGGPHPSNSDLVRFIMRDAITRDNNPHLTQMMEGKDRWTNTHNAVIMSMLAGANVPVAFRDHVSAEAFDALLCGMIPLEVIARRVQAEKGSARKREPRRKALERSALLGVEFFLKTTKGELRVPGINEPLITGLSADQDDPFILNPYDPYHWKLRHPKEPLDAYGCNAKGEELDLGEINPQQIGMDPRTIGLIEHYQRSIFLQLEAFLARYDLRLLDLKCEYGIDPSGRLVLADVITLDEMRLHRREGDEWREVSKQLFRDGAPIPDIANAYRWFADLLSSAVVPRQAVVFWRASKSDPLPNVSRRYNGVDYVEIMGDPNNKYEEGRKNKLAVSGHEMPERALEILNRLERDYPGGFVICAIVGASNGLAPMLQAATTKQVITASPSMQEWHEDIWSSLRRTSGVPPLVVGSVGHLVDAAHISLARSNPYIAADLRHNIENKKVVPDFDPGKCIHRI